MPLNMKDFYNSFIPTSFQKRRRSEKQKVSTNASQQSSDKGASCSIHLIYEGENPVVDIVAIHGLGGHWRRSWTDIATGTFWLQDLLPKDVPETRIVSCNYDATGSSTTAMEDIAVELLAGLIKMRKDTNTEDRPIVFLAHSFGGPLLQGALALAFHELDGTSPERGKIRRSTYGSLFFGVGKSTEDGFNNLAAVALNNAEAHTASDTPLMKALKRDLLWKKETSSTYARMCDDFVSKYFVESASGTGAEETLSSPQDPSDLLSSDSIHLSKTHGQMIRFPNTEDEDYRRACSCLVAMVAEATKSVSGKKQQ